MDTNKCICIERRPTCPQNDDCPVWDDSLCAAYTPDVPLYRPMGCICPPGSNLTCQSANCPRRGERAQDDA